MQIAPGALAGGAGWHRSSAHGISGCRVDYLPASAAMPTLDTLTITSRVKDVLCYHGIGQKLFGEAVLGLSQGSVSDMLSKPKPWELLSVKGREPFVKMHYWLSDPNNVERLQALQAEVKASRKMATTAADDASSDRSSPCIKKARYSFTDDQKRVLRTAFAQDPYPTSASIDALAQRMGLSTKTVINWFHNHRMRSKQQLRDGEDHQQQQQPQHGLSNVVAVTAPDQRSANANTEEIPAKPDVTAAASSRRLIERRTASTCDESAASAAACSERLDDDSNCGGSLQGRLDFGGFRCSTDDHDRADRSEGDFYDDDDDEDDDMFEVNGHWSAAGERLLADQQRQLSATATVMDTPDSGRDSYQASGGSPADGASAGGQTAAAAYLPCVGSSGTGSSSRKRKSSHPQYVHQGRDLDHRDDDAGASPAGASADQRHHLAAATAARTSESSSPTAADASTKAISAEPPAYHPGETEAARVSAEASGDRVESSVGTAAADVLSASLAAIGSRQEKLDFVERMERLIGRNDGSSGDTDWDEPPDRKGNVELLEQNLARTQASAAGDDWCV